MPNWSSGDEDSLPPDTRGQGSLSNEPNVSDEEAERVIFEALSGEAPKRRLKRSTAIELLTALGLPPTFPVEHTLMVTAVDMLSPEAKADLHQFTRP